MKRIVLYGITSLLCLTTFISVEAQPQKQKTKQKSTSQEKPADEQKVGDAASTNKETTKEIQKDDESLTFSGILVNKSGLPIKGKTVCLIIRDPNGKILALYGMKDGQVVLANPNGKTDDKGQFTIQMKPYLKNESDTDELEFGICEGSRGYGLTKVKIDGKTTKVDLGKIVD